MLSIGLAAGIFKPLISGTVRAVTDKTNKTLGFGIFYAMVNVGGSFGPIVAGKLRAISWNHAFVAAAVMPSCVMLLITIFFYKEPPRETRGKSRWVRSSGRSAMVAVRRSSSPRSWCVLGLFFWLAVLGLLQSLRGLRRPQRGHRRAVHRSISGIPVIGTWLANFLSHEEDGVRRILGETISHTGYIIMILQVFVSRWIETFRAMPSFMFGLFVAAVGFVVLGLAGSRVLGGVWFSSGSSCSPWAR